MINLEEPLFDECIDCGTVLFSSVDVRCHHCEHKNEDLRNHNHPPKRSTRGKGNTGPNQFTKTATNTEDKGGLNSEDYSLHMPFTSEGHHIDSDDSYDNDLSESFIYSNRELRF